MHTDIAAHTSLASPKSPDSWTIAETALHFDITTRAIRFYEDKGLITPARSGGHRVFCDVDKLRIEKILRAKRIGFSLDDIKQFLDVTDGDVRERKELLARKAQFEAVIKRLRRKRRDIEIVSKDMQDLCAAIDDFIATTPETGVFQFAEAYQAKLQAHMADDFLPL